MGDCGMGLRGGGERWTFASPPRLCGRGLPRLPITLRRASFVLATGEIAPASPPRPWG